MTKAGFALILALLPVAAQAEEWQRLTGEELHAAFAARSLVSEEKSATYGFAQDGTASFESKGRRMAAFWRIEDDRICLTPAEQPDKSECGTVERNGIDLRLINDKGQVALMRYNDL